MSCDTDYTLTVYATEKRQLQELKKYCQMKKARWDAWESSGRSADELLKETGEEDYSDVVSWGYHWGNIRRCDSGYMMAGTSWANENCSNLHIKGSKGELASIARKFPQIEWEVYFEDEYDWSGLVTEPYFEAG